MSKRDPRKVTIRRSTATRCMALLVGLHFQEGRRISREQLGASLRRSVRTVHAVLKDLENRGWIQTSGGGNGTPGYITVINELSWKNADVADDRPKTADVSPKTADDRRALNLKVIQGKERQTPSPFRGKTYGQTQPGGEDWAAIERFAAAAGLRPPTTGAEIEAVMSLMDGRKPPEPETGRNSAAVAV